MYKSLPREGPGKMALSWLTRAWLSWMSVTGSPAGRMEEGRKSPKSLESHRNALLWEVWPPRRYSRGKCPSVVCPGSVPGFNKGLVICTLEMCWWQDGMSNSCLRHIRTCVSYATEAHWLYVAGCGSLIVHRSARRQDSLHSNPGLCQVSREYPWSTETI